MFKKYITRLTVVIMALADRGRVEIVESIPLICERKIKDSFFATGMGSTLPSATMPQSHLSTWRKSGFLPVKVTIIADGIIIYLVNIEVKQHLQNGSIFRDTPFRLTVHCSFALAQTTQLGIEVQREQSEYSSTLKSKGILRAEMRFAKDSSYRSFYSSRDPPIVTELGQPVYVEVFLLKHEDKDLVLLLEDCWATPTEDPYDPQRWNLLVKGCPFTGDSHRTAVLPVVSNKELKYPSLHKWFMVKLFSFVKPSTFETQAYFHCDVEICKGPDCLHSCSNGGRKLRRITSVPGQRIPYTVVSAGPLLYLL
ncbi:zona pellucida sperm-binding protein 4-like isoform X4 [Trachinotus anak]|uniref:zona pellucida sperm-binding protein 4-like isoform X4 n=1 Tax=Trachinotus anak TaxID=443729 RepID=UPI0039F20704